MEFIEVLGSVTGIHATVLVIVKQGGITAEQGAWVHPDVAIHLAQWCSAKFAVQVSRWVRERFTTGLTPKATIDFSDPVAVCELYLEAEERHRQSLELIATVSDEARILAESKVIAVTKDKEALPIAAEDAKKTTTAVVTATDGYLTIKHPNSANRRFPIYPQPPTFQN